jgi:hypothetical protein
MADSDGRLPLQFVTESGWNFEEGVRVTIIESVPAAHSQPWLAGWVIKILDGKTHLVPRPKRG